MARLFGCRQIKKRPYRSPNRQKRRGVVFIYRQIQQEVYIVMTQNQGNSFTKNPKPRSFVYVDGFNMYNGSIKGTAHKWLNLQKYFELLRQDDDVISIYYFTALRMGTRGDRQQVYLNALETLPKVNVVVGRYKRKTATCHVSSCTFSGNRNEPSPTNAARCPSQRENGRNERKASRSSADNCRWRPKPSRFCS